MVQKNKYGGFLEKAKTKYEEKITVIQTEQSVSTKQQTKQEERGRRCISYQKPIQQQ